MKMIFFLVALANVALFMWEFNKGAFEPVSGITDSAISSGQERIVLVNELNKPLPGEVQITTVKDRHEAEAGMIDKLAAENKGDAASRTVTSFDVPAPDGELSADKCYEAGPFADERLFDEWYEQLTAANAEIKVLSRTRQTVSDYQVYYPSAETLEQSEANLEMLKSRGLNDVWMLRQGTEKGQISLGVFKKEERAQVMKDQLLAKGINVEIKPRYKNRLSRLVLIKEGSNVPESVQGLEKSFPGIALKPAANCSEDQPGQ